MSANKDLMQFVRDALSAGRGRDEISGALIEAGWSDTETRDAMNAWSETNFVPPIPRPQSMVTARDFFVYALTFGLLVFATIYLVLLGHALIDLAFEKDGGYRSTYTIRWSIAILIVTTPPYFWLTWRERRKLLGDPSLYRSAVRKWLIYITLLIASSVLLGDLVSVIYALLGGGFTVPFVAKTAVVAAVAGGVCLFYLSDIQRGESV